MALAGLKKRKRDSSEEDNKMEGTVKWFNFEKQFGFIEVEGQSDIFVHISGLAAGTEINEGDKVKFDTEKDVRGEKAINVTKID